MRIQSLSFLRLLSVFLISGCLALAVSVAQAKPLTINLGYASAAKGNAYSVLADEFEKLVEEYSNGEIDIKVRCCTQLATEDEAFKGMQLGSIDMYLITSNNVSPHYPLMDAFILPYIFQSKEHAYKILEGEVGKKFARDFFKKTGVHLLTYGYVGVRDFYNSARPIRTLADMKGMKVRVPKNQVMLETYKAFGAAPIPLAWAETPTALQTGTVSGGDNGVTFIKSQKFYEVCNNLAITEHFAYFNPLFASNRIMKKMTDKQRDIIHRAAEEAGQRHKEIMDNKIAAVKGFLKEEGKMTVTQPERASFIKAAVKVQEDFIREKNNQELEDLVKAIRAAAN